MDGNVYGVCGLSYFFYMPFNENRSVVTTSMHALVHTASGRYQRVVEIITPRLRIG